MWVTRFIRVTLAVKYEESMLQVDAQATAYKRVLARVADAQSRTVCPLVRFTRGYAVFRARYSAPRSNSYVLEDRCTAGCRSAVPLNFVAQRACGKSVRSFNGW